MNGHPQLDDFELYALGAMDPEERSALESHLGHCALCRQSVAEARERMATLALTVPQQVPSARVKRQLMERIHESGVNAAAPPRMQPREGFWRRASVAWSFAAVAAIVAIVFIVRASLLAHSTRQYQAQAQSQRSLMVRANAIVNLLTAKDTRTFTLTALPTKLKPMGKVLYAPAVGMLFYAENLPAPPPARVYQLWLVPTKGKPISAGVFTPGSNGNASIILPNLPKGIAAAAFAVTVEPDGGEPQPTGPKVLVGAS